MKKIFGFMVVCLMTAVLFVSASAQGDNFLEKEWEKGTLGATMEKTEIDGETVYKGGNISAAYVSPMVSVYDAVKEASGGEDATVTIAMKVRIEYKKGKEDSETQMRILLRGTPADKKLVKEPDEWNDKYESDLEDTALFKNASGNVMFTNDRKKTVNDSEWTLVEWTFDVAKDEMESDMLTDWNLCVDTLSNPKDISAILFKDTGVYLTEDYESEAPESDPTPEPEEEEPTVTMKVLYGSDGNLLENKDGGQTPESTDGVQNTDGGLEQNGENSKNPYWWIWVVAAVAAVGCAVTVSVIIKNKKKSAK